MFSFLKKIDKNLYTETEKLKKLFQSGEDLPYLNQIRIVFEGLITYLAKNEGVVLTENTLGAKAYNSQIKYYLEYRFNFDFIEFDDFLN